MIINKPTLSPFTGIKVHPVIHFNSYEFLSDMLAFNKSMHLINKFVLHRRLSIVPIQIKL